MTHKLIKNINQCLIPKFSKNFDEKDNHIEFQIRNDNLIVNFQSLERNLAGLDMMDIEESSPILASLLNLCIELGCDCPWNDTHSKEYADKLNVYIELLYGFQLKNIMYHNNIFNKQAVFNKLLDDLRRKLTYADFKKYPGQIEVYYLIIKDLKNYKVHVKLLQIMPVSLILIDDYIKSNTIIGLKCCSSILQCLTAEDFAEGNYHEVIYRSLMKTFLDKDIEIINLTHLCLLQLCRTIPAKEKHNKLEDLYTNILDKLYTESNIHRKAKCLEFTRSIISLHQDNCIGKNKHFNLIICDCLDMCTNIGVAEVLLLDTLQCFEEWIKYCWCVWKLPSDHKIISTLFKVLYTNKDERTDTRIQNILITLICLCNPIEQKKILFSLEKNFHIINDNFKSKLTKIKIQIEGVNYLYKMIERSAQNCNKHF